MTPVFKTSVKIGNKSIRMSDHMDDPMETHLNSSLIESWGSKTEQTQAQSGSKPEVN